MKIDLSAHPISKNLLPLPEGTRRGSPEGAQLRGGVRGHRLPYFLARFAALTVFDKSIDMVIGPTPIKKAGNGIRTRDFHLGKVTL